MRVLILGVFAASLMASTSLTYAQQDRGPPARPGGAAPFGERRGGAAPVGERPGPSGFPRVVCTPPNKMIDGKCVDPFNPRYPQPGFLNPLASGGQQHLDAVLTILKELLTVRQEDRNDETIQRLEKEYFEARGIEYQKPDFPPHVGGFNLDAFLNQTGASPRAKAAINKVIELVKRGEPVPDFERDFTALEISVVRNLQGDDLKTFYRFTATVAHDYAFFFPGGQGSELVHAVFGLDGEASAPEGMKKWMKWILCDAIGAISGGVTGAVVGGVVGAVAGTLSEIVSEQDQKN